ncbi:MAG: TetR/AcrR family transcriptional regulator, partial [Methanospirillum sp.]|uniref:TetR/AcrR family transcriptional regulator n=1 Tax=Methanospirillum sp. TaxID=45200 RepID=UPI002373E0A9
MVNIDRKKRKTERKRSEIIATAERLFQQRGFEQVTMEEIADELDVSKSSIYVYFKNKDTLFFSILLQKWYIYLEKLKEKINQGQTGLEKINNMIQFTLEFSKQNPEYSKMTTHNSSQIFQRIDRES